MYGIRKYLICFSNSKGTLAARLAPTSSLRVLCTFFSRTRNAPIIAKWTGSSIPRRTISAALLNVSSATGRLRYLRTCSLTCTDDECEALKKGNYGLWLMFTRYDSNA